ncbi:MAG: hypothetical protein JSR33_03205 [Proteobacteria bacterium]|nr:hypothetical protein [Pseudomonadota bacterium]
MKKLIAISCLAALGITSVSLAATSSALVPLSPGTVTCRANNLNKDTKVKFYSLDKKLLLSLKNSEAGSFVNAQKQIIIETEGDSFFIHGIIPGIIHYCMTKSQGCRSNVECTVS